MEKEIGRKMMEDGKSLSKKSFEGEKEYNNNEVKENGKRQWMGTGRLDGNKRYQK